MADDDPWGFDDDAKSNKSNKSLKSRAGTPTSLGGKSAGGKSGKSAGAASDTRPEMEPAVDDGHYRKPLTLNKHWVRCVHLLRGNSSVQCRVLKKMKMIVTDRE